MSTSPRVTAALLAAAAATVGIGLAVAAPAAARPNDGAGTNNSVGASSPSAAAAIATRNPCDVAARRVDGGLGNRFGSDGRGMRAQGGGPAQRAAK
ncbi:MAG: hypothetical protein QOE41_1845 [Mycobacterium sp.]|jgi:hypothetical protein|nr:hypothetical protein [Mycobacterium sp.]MDT5132534.1 hypothetical protein [Mycobacterium sp.]